MTTSDELRVSFYGLSLGLPDGWVEITDDLPDGSPPTLARSDGVGAAQFSIALYASGKAPHVGQQDLRDLLQDFASQHAINIGAVIDVEAKCNCAYATGESEGHLLGVWYLSDGENIALVTYVADDQFADRAGIELTQVARFVASAEFQKQT